MNTRRLPGPIAKYLIAAALALSALGSLCMALHVPPAAAQVTVFDPANYTQNLLSAARALTQINNQIQALQNQATMLMNQAKNLRRIDFPELRALTTTMQQIDQLMGSAQGVSYRVGSVENEFQHLFPQSLAQALTTHAGVVNAKARLDASMAAFSQTMQVQAQVVSNVTGDTAALAAIVQKSQGAEGSLQAQQATNQLLVLAAKQKFQIQTMMAAQYRAETLEVARRAQAESDARVAARTFLGSGTAYHPQ